MRTWIAVGVLFAYLLTTGCARHRVKYVPFAKWSIEPTAGATAIDGDVDAALALLQQAPLPHNSLRSRVQLQWDGLRALTSQLGSDDYILLGEVTGGGNAKANHATLAQAFCEKAAENGGDVVLIYRRETVEQPWTHSTPGYSYTTGTATAYGNRNYAHAYGTSQTTYSHGQVYSGVVHKPRASGLVLKHVPGAEKERQALLQLGDEELARIMPELEALALDPNLTFTQARKRWLSLFAESGTKSGNNAMYEAAADD